MCEYKQIMYGTIRSVLTFRQPKTHFRSEIIRVHLSSPARLLCPASFRQRLLLLLLLLLLLFLLLFLLFEAANISDPTGARSDESWFFFVIVVFVVIFVF